jgi:hypothetical protein
MRNPAANTDEAAGIHSVLAKKPPKAMMITYRADSAIRAAPCDS